MAALDPLSLDEGLKAVQCPRVGLEDDLREAGDKEADINPRGLGQEDGGPDFLETLCGQAGDVEDLLDMGQPLAVGQPTHPLVQTLSAS